MRPPRNPFRLRASEQIDDDSQFLALYEPGLLDALPEDPWNRRVVVRSSPGGGKTSLLRVFTPGPLRLLHAKGGRDEQTAELHKRLSELGVLDRRGPTVAAALLSLAGKYTPLDQLTRLDEASRLRAFMALLNVRVLLAGLRAHLQLANMAYPDALSRIWLDDALPRLGRGTGLDVYRHAHEIENQVADALSSLRPSEESTLPGDDELSCLEALGPDRVRLEGRPVHARTVVLLDDVHRLSEGQRRLLVDTLLAHRTSTPVWIAERREALTPEELLSEGARSDRDRELVDLESYWRGSRARGFQRVVTGIADRRIQLAPDESGSSFAGMLEPHDDAAWEAVLPDVERRLSEAGRGRKEFAAWIESQVGQATTARDRAIGMRSLEIRIERELASAQTSLDLLVRDESALEELERRPEAASLREAAELFLCSEHGLPFYHGSERLALLAFANVDQFLNLAGDLFEEVAGASVLRRTVALSPARQDARVRAAVGEMWEHLGSTVQGGGRLRSLLDGFGEYCAKRTYLPTAPYLPGVTGLALPRSQAEELQAALPESSQSWQGRLARLLATLVAHNLVSVQGSEGKQKRWTVYYLNRALCVRYGLALRYGGWQPTTAEQLWAWSRGDAVRSPQQLAVK